MAASETESGNNFQTASDGVAIPKAIPTLSNIDHARLKYVTANIARHGPTTEIQKGGHQAGSGNNFKLREMRRDSNLRHSPIFGLARPENDTVDIVRHFPIFFARRWPTTDNQDGGHRNRTWK